MANKIKRFMKFESETRQVGPALAKSGMQFHSLKNGDRISDGNRTLTVKSVAADHAFALDSDGKQFKIEGKKALDKYRIVEALAPRNGEDVLQPISVNVYRSASGGDSSLGGISSKESRLTIVSEGVESKIEEDHLILKKKNDYMYAVPKSVIDSGEWPMFGGNFAYTSDSRFRQVCKYPVPIHDRVEGRAIKENDTKVEILSMSPRQFYYLYELMTSDITMYDTADMEHYSNETGLEVETLLDMYAGYGSASSPYKFDKFRDAYMRSRNLEPSAEGWQKLKKLAGV